MTLKLKNSSPPLDWISRISFEAPPEELIPGDNISLDVVQGEGNWDSLYFFGAYDPIKIEGYGSMSFSRWIEYKSFDKKNDPKPWSFNFVVPDTYEGELRIRFSNYGHRELFVEWVYRPGETPLELSYSPVLLHLEPGFGTDVGFAGELVATLKDDNGRPIEGKTVFFFIDKEEPSNNEPGKNLFDVLDYQKGGSAGPKGSSAMEYHPYLKKIFIYPELSDFVKDTNRIFLGDGIKTDSKGEVVINLIEYGIINPQKFSSELVRQKENFQDKGKISGMIVAGVYDEKTKFITRQAAIEIKYPAMAKILLINGEGPSEEFKQAWIKEHPEDAPWGPGPVRVKRFTTFPQFDYQPVSEGFLLMPGDIVEIDSGVKVEIAWVNGNKVTVGVPVKDEAETSVEYHERARLIMLSSAHDSGFDFPKTTAEKVFSSVFGFGQKKGIEAVIESIPYVGKIIKEGNALAVEIFKGVKGFDWSEVDVFTRLRIRSKVIIDSTGEDLKVYNIEGSPDIQTVQGGEVTLGNGEMVTVSDTGILGKVETFNVSEVENRYYEDTPNNSDKATGSGSSSWLIVVGVAIGALIVLMVFLVMRKRFKKQ